jgi:hypothetical protein
MEQTVLAEPALGAVDGAARDAEATRDLALGLPVDQAVEDLRPQPAALFQ